MQHLLLLILLPISTNNYSRAEGAPGGTPRGPPATCIFEFNNTFIENLAMLPNGRLLLTAFGPGSLYVLQPEATHITAESLVNLDGSTGLSGIAALGGDKYAISGGVHTSFSFQEGSMKVYVVLLAP